MSNIIPQSANIFNIFAKFLFTVLIIGFVNTSITNSIPALDLKSTSNFVVLAGSTVTGIPPYNIVGDVGLSPATGSNITGFDATNVDGKLYAVDASGPAGAIIDAILLQTAKSDLTTAYNDAAGRTPIPTGPFLNPGSGNLGGLNLVPGLYKFTSDCQITGSDLTLTGNSTDVWIFQISTSLNLGSGIKITLAGGAQASNIFWQVGSSATLGTYSTFQGTILAEQSVSIGTEATLNGRALAFTAAVTMASDVSMIIPVTTPVVTTLLGSSVTKTAGNATLQGEITAGANITQRGFVISTSTGTYDTWNSDNSATVTLGSGSTGSFTLEVRNLGGGNTQYYAYATNADGTGQGSTATFTTDLATNPTLTTSSAVTAGPNFVTVSGEVTDGGGRAIQEYGFVYATTQNPTTANSKVVYGENLALGALTDMKMSSRVSGLNLNTRYYVRSYVTNDAGTFYGNQVSIMTTPTMPEWAAIISIASLGIFGGWWSYRKFVA